MSLVSKNITDLSLERKSGILQQQFHNRIASREYYPLSFAQERLWFIDQFNPGDFTYNIYTSSRLMYAVNEQAMERSLNEIVNRHEALRTTFAVVDDHPVQVVSPTFKLPLELIDLSRLPDLDRQQKLQQLADREARTPFDLSRGPLLRVTLVRLAVTDHVLLLTMHHIVSDAWSMGVLFDELGKLYHAFSHGWLSPLPPLPIQYADYALWQRQWLQGDVLQQQLSYWRSQLKDAPAVIELPADRPRPAVQTFNGATQGFVVPKAITDRIKHMSQREGVTMFMSLLAAFKILLMRYTGVADIVIGTPIANRTQAEVEGLIGFFTNTLVLRSVIGDQATYRDVLKTVREVTLDSYAHQDLPFEKLVEELEPERDLSHNPLFQVMFVLQNTPTMTQLASNEPENSSSTSESASEPAAPDVLSQPDAGEPLVWIGTSKFDLTLSITETGWGLMGAVEYSTDLFDHRTISRMAGHFRTLLEGIAANPDQRISELPIMAEAERKQVLIEWNGRKDESIGEQLLHELFEREAEKRPDAIALVFEEEEITYRDLNARANRLGNYLKSIGVGPDVLVGVCIERSIEMLVALLGVFKAGGAYVPLDPSHPKERLDFMLKDTRIKALLTLDRLKENLPDLDAPVIYLDAGWEAIARASDEKPRTDVTPDNLVYVIYTSGSTGKPKAAMLVHRDICNRLMAGIKVYRLDETSAFLHKTPLTFDPSVIEIFSSLLIGSRLVIALPGGERDGAYLVRLIRERQITHAFFVPSMLHVFLEEPEVRSCVSLKMVESAAEVLTGDLKRRFFERLDAGLCNFYGPTEASISPVCFLCTREDNRRAVPIGKPIANVRTYLLDTSLQPVPVGVAGEVHIGGIAPGRGYLNRPELTAERFIPDSFHSEGGLRLYKTGDLARHLPDGNIEFLHRKDLQVKIRGYRIELEEIELTLRQHPAVQDCAVIVREDRVDDKRLVAYFTLKQDRQPPTSIELRSFLKKKLPDYMIPFAFVILDELPLTANGKVERRALPAPDANAAETGMTYVAPTSPTEQALANIWAEVIGLEKVGAQDNFFELGGHSLLATQVVTRVRGVLGVEVPLRSIFEMPTVAALAAEIDQNGGQRTAPLTGSIGKISRRGKKEEPTTTLDHLSDGEVDSLLKELLAKMTSQQNPKP